MNKQEVIKSIEDEKILGLTITYDDTRYNEGLITAKRYVEQIDEPEKPIVPQFVADWYEDHKSNLELYLSELCINFTYHIELLNDKFANWYARLENKPMQTLVNMHQFGYEVQKEKLYTVELPNPNGNGYCKMYLAKNDEGKVELFTWSGYTSIEFADNWKLEENAQLTEEEIKEDYEWLWEAGLAKEVK